MKTKPADYYKDYINVKNSKVAANIELMYNKLRPSTVIKQEASPTSITSLKMGSAISDKKMNRQQLRIKFNLKKTDWKKNKI